MDSPKLALAVAVAALIPSIYGASLPPLATVRGEMDSAHIAAAHTAAMWTTGALVGVATVVSQSPEVFLLSGGMAAVYALLYRRARQVSP